MNRRIFLGTSASSLALGGAAAAQGSAQSQPAAQPPAQQTGDRIVVGIMGTGGRGTSLAATFQGIPNVQIAYVCDVDTARAERCAAAVGRIPGANAPRVVQDFRRILDDRTVDVFVCAACNHWHAPATILACSAGKHVYVEKPCSHNCREGELMVAAARKHNRHVQMGNQRRSWPRIIEGIEEVRKGTIGRAYYAQAFYLANRGTIGRGKEGPPPAGLDYDLWQGPAPRRPYRSNYLHYNWHWFWHWGNGELGNNGVHYIDLCRWGLGVDYPTRVSSTGGRWRFQDDQETPDTNMVTYDFADRKSIRWEGMSCNQMPAGRGAEVIFHGENGSLAIEAGGYRVFDRAGKELRHVNGPRDESLHIQNFLNVIRGNGRLNSEIEIAKISTHLCHLGNISYRLGRTLNIDPKTGRVTGDREAMATNMWSREYAPGWEPRV